MNSVLGTGSVPVGRPKCVCSSGPVTVLFVGHDCSGYDLGGTQRCCLDAEPTVPILRVDFGIMWDCCRKYKQSIVELLYSFLF